MNRGLKQEEKPWPRAFGRPDPGDPPPSFVNIGAVGAWEPPCSPSLGAWRAPAPVDAPVKLGRPTESADSGVDLPPPNLELRSTEPPRGP
ncbi:hypothetical protein NDU88_003403 [Pleurodeles waltl]|uniref:Uncharacterized protein n=1 Tax=Pleurodeles waltl TaxID=8319 RepID=A0AAV7RI39_PLEWA|nr:hypothetical protein NDU88_003403 [Pleurodeles waltl]